MTAEYLGMRAAETGAGSRGFPATLPHDPDLLLQCLLLGLQGLVVGLKLMGL